jgi:hypothetical protein
MNESYEPISPCPFCGSEASLQASRVYSDGTTKPAYGYCPCCKSLGPWIDPSSIVYAKLPEGEYATLVMLDDARPEADQAAINS